MESLRPGLSSLVSENANRLKTGILSMASLTDDDASSTRLFLESCQHKWRQSHSEMKALSDATVKLQEDRFDSFEHFFEGCRGRDILFTVFASKLHKQFRTDPPSGNFWRRKASSELREVKRCYDCFAAFRSLLIAIAAGSYDLIAIPS